MKYLSLFSGIGGFELGINKANVDWQCVGFSEIEEKAIQVYKTHFPDTINFGDITKLNPSSLPNFNILVGGFPCQPYSLAGHREGLEDSKGRGHEVFDAMLNIIKVCKPFALFFENVSALRSHNDGKTFSYMKHQLESLGYDIGSTLLSSKEFGVPQDRKRLFIIGFRKGLTTNKLDELTSSTFKLFNQKADPELSLYQLKELGIEEAKVKQEKAGFYKQSVKDKNSNNVRRKMRIPPKYTFIDTKAGAFPIYKFLETSPPESVYLLAEEIPKMKHFGADYSFGGSLSSSPIHSTITASYGRITGNSMKFLRNSKLSILSPIEAERLQGFPDNWTNVEGLSFKDRYKCIGNAVTTNVIAGLADYINKKLAPAKEMRLAFLKEADYIDKLLGNVRDPLIINYITESMATHIATIQKTLSSKTRDYRTPLQAATNIAKNICFEVALVRYLAKIYPNVTIGHVAKDKDTASSDKLCPDLFFKKPGEAKQYIEVKTSEKGHFCYRNNQLNSTIFNYNAYTLCIDKVKETYTILSCSDVIKLNNSNAIKKGSIKYGSNSKAFNELIINKEEFLPFSNLSKLDKLFN